MWLGVGCSEGNAKEAERPVGCVRGRQESEPSYDRCGWRFAARGTGITNRAEGRWGRKVET